MTQQRSGFVQMRRSSICVFVCILGAAVAPLVNAQSSTTSDSTGASRDIEEEIRLLREQVVQLRAEVTSLRDELHTRDGQLAEGRKHETADQVAGTATYDDKTQIQANSPRAQTTPFAAADAAGSTDAQAGQGESDLAATVGLLQSQVAQLAQTKVEASSKWPIKIYGTILSTTFYNTHDVDWADVPLKVDQNSGVFRAGSFSSSLRQSRIGLEVDGPAIGSFKTTGVFAMDFMGGMIDFQATPLFGLANIVYGYARLENDNTAFEAGQDEMIFAPQNPRSLVAYSYPELWQAGNLYLRAPQLRAEQKLVGSQKGQMRLTLGLIAPVGTYRVLDFPGGGGREGLRPSVQARLSWRSAPPGSLEKSSWEMGISGTYGRVNLPLVDTSGKVVSSFSAASWAGAVDFNAHYHRVGLDGEGYWGRDLERFGGGIGQPGKAIGGYFEGRLDLTPRLNFDLGLGNDHLLKFNRIPVELNRNTGLFANIIFHFTPEVGASLEYRYMETRPFVGAIRRNDNVSLGFAYSF